MNPSSRTRFPLDLGLGDLFELNGRDYLLTVDYYSNYFEVDRVSSKQGPEVMHKLKTHFAQHGIRDTVVSDIGLPFHSREFGQFVNRYEIEHETSSPVYPRSNGKAENAVKTAKNIMIKRWTLDSIRIWLSWTGTILPVRGWAPPLLKDCLGAEQKLCCQQQASC